jgi:hypothetical protein
VSVITYLDVRDSVVAQLKEKFAPQPRIHIGPHPGTFNEEEIRRLANQTPAILSSLMRIRDGDVQDESWCDFVSWVLYRADNKDRLYDGALKMVSALIPVIRGVNTAWSISGGQKIEAECLYSGSTDRMNITLWAVRWSWQLRGTVFDGEEGGILLPDDLDYFEGYDAAHLVGTQEVNDEVHLEVDYADSDEANPEQPAGTGPV